MKSICTLALSLLLSGAYAQTLTQSDLPFAGLGWTSGTDTNYTDPVPAGGAAQSWDFSTLQYSYVDTSGFGVSAGTPYASTFPGANLAAHKLSTDEWTYFTNASTGFYVNGFVSNAATFVFNPQQMYVPVPFSYGDMHTDISRVLVDTTFITYAAQVIINFHADFHADGYGSLITPTTTYPSTLRVRETMLETDSLLVDYTGTGNYTFLGSQQSQKTYFRWFTHGGTANYILGIDADSLGTFATRSDYLMQWAVLGIDENENEASVEVFPNPAKANVSFSVRNSAIETIQLFDIQGKKQMEVNLSSLSPRAEIDISTLAEGIYFYSLSTGDHQIRGKFNVVR